MEAHEHGRALRIGERGAIVERRIFIAVAREEHVNALLLELDSSCSRERQRNVFLDDAGGAAGAIVRAAVAGIEDYDERRLLRRNRW